MAAATAVRFGLVLAMLASAASAASAADWPRFRGPDGAGVSAEKNIPVKWDDGAKPLWRTPIPGSGHASPVIWGDDVFVTTSVQGGKVRELLCLKLSDGSVRWKKELPADPVAVHKAKGSPAAASPAVDADRVYVCFASGVKANVWAFDKSGTQVWQREIGEFTCKHGWSTSPVLADGMVIVANDTAGKIDNDGDGTDGESFLIALDAAGGGVRWKTVRATGRAVFSTPLVVGSAVVTTSQAEGVTAYEIKTGKKLWGTGMLNQQRTVASPFLADGLICANWGQGGGGTEMAAVKPGEGGGEVVWKLQKMLPYVPTPVAYGKHIFVLSDGGVASCLTAGTGKTVWNERLGGKFVASPIVVDGKVYCISEDGEVVVFAAATEYKLLGRSKLNEPVFATPAVAAGKLLVRTHGALVCIGKK